MVVWLRRPNLLNILSHLEGAAIDFAQAILAAEKGTPLWYCGFSHCEILDNGDPDVPGGVLYSAEAGGVMALDPFKEVETYTADGSEIIAYAPMPELSPERDAEARVWLKRTKGKPYNFGYIIDQGVDALKRIASLVGLFLPNPVGTFLALIPHVGIMDESAFTCSQHEADFLNRFYGGAFALDSFNPADNWIPVKAGMLVEIGNVTNEPTPWMGPGGPG